MTRPLDAPVNLISHSVAKCTTKERGKVGADGRDPEGSKQHTSQTHHSKSLQKVHNLQDSSKRFVLVCIEMLTRKWRRRKRNPVPGHLMETCLALRRLLDAHQLENLIKCHEGYSTACASRHSPPHNKRPNLHNRP